MNEIIEDIVSLLSGKSLEEVQSSFAVNGDEDLEKLIEVVTALLIMLMQDCDNPTLLAEASDIRLPLFKGILKARLYKYLKALGSDLKLKDVYNAFLDVGKKTSQENIIKTWNEVND